MNHLLTAFLCILTSSLFAQSFGTTEPIPVATGYGNYHPQIEMTNDGFPAVIWTNQADNTIYFAKHDGVSAFGTPIQLNPTGLDVQSYNWSGPDLAQDGDNMYVVYRSLGYETGHIYLVKSIDNGVTFGDTVRVDDLATGFGQYPDVAVFQDTVWITFMDHEAGSLNPQYVVARSIDGGATFESEVSAGALWTGEACDCCPPEIIVDDSRVIVYFRNNNSNTRDIKAVVSNDRGATFSDMFSVDDHAWYITGCPSTGPDARFMGPDKTVSIYRTQVAGAGKVFVNEYNLQTSSSDALVEVTATSSTGAIINYPQIDSKDDVIGIVWETSANGIDAFINVSSTGATGLDPNNAFNLSDTTGTQNKPDIVIGNGVFHLVYMDSDGQDIKYMQASFLAGVGDSPAELETLVYPVPASENVTISFDNPNQEEYTIELFDLQGRSIFKDVGTTNQLSINKDQVAAGIFTYTLTSKSFSGLGKIIFE